MITQEQFNAAILPFTLKFEGGYANNKADKGGETYRGISRTNHPTWAGWPIIDKIKATNPLRRGDIVRDKRLNDLVYEFYYKKIFEAGGLAEINSVLVSLVAFDFLVHGGYATITMQKLINRKFGGTLDVDGDWGDATRKAVNSIPEKDLALALLAVRRQRLLNIIEKDSSQEEFREGWMSRIDYLVKLVNKNS